MQKKQLRIEVKGSRAGTLLSLPSLASSGQPHQWTPPFIVDCSHEDELYLCLYHNENEQVGRSFFACQSFVKREKAHLQ